MRGASEARGPEQRALFAGERRAHDLAQKLGDPVPLGRRHALFDACPELVPASVERLASWIAKALRSTCPRRPKAAPARSESTRPIQTVTAG